MTEGTERTAADVLAVIGAVVVAGAGLGTLAVGIRDLLAGDALSLNPGPDPA